MQLRVHSEFWPAITPFRITGRVYDGFESIVVQLSHDGHVGRGEALGVPYLGDSVERMLAQVRAIKPTLLSGLDRTQLQAALPPGARNAIDAAMWDLQAKTTGHTIWQLCGVAPKPVDTLFTIGIEATAQQMAAKASAARAFTALKIKLDANQPVERVRAIRHVRPDASLVVDANQGWTFEQLEAVAPALALLGVQMIEQPLPRGADDALQTYRSPLPLYADESCQHLGELDLAAERYQGINIKLDKTGGLTHALELAKAVRQRGLGLMAGSMCGSSLAMAPSFVIACLSDLVDIDGPLLQQSDRTAGLRYAGGRVDVFGPELWG